MGTANVSTREREAEEGLESLSKGDFPKLKAAKTTVSPQKTAPVQAEDIRVEKSPPFYFWIGIALFLAQVCLFIATLALLRGFYERTTMAVKDLVPAKAELNRPISYPQASKEETVLPSSGTAGKRFVICDFNRTDFKTNLDTDYRVQPDEISSRTLKIAVDSENRYGPAGNSLRIDFSFGPQETKPSAIGFHLPGISIARWNVFSFRLRASDSYTSQAPRLKVELYDSENRQIGFVVGPILPFWKKYEFQLPEALPTFSKEALSGIHFALEPVPGTPASGSWYLDELQFEQGP